MRLAQGIATVLAAASLAGAALAQDEDIGAGAPVIARGAPISEQDINTETGRSVLLFHYVHIDRACVPTAVAIQLTAEPAHGVFTLRDGEERPWRDGHPLFAAGDPRARCGNRLAASRDGVYTPAPGFTGHDTLTVEFTEAGVAVTDAIAVSVR